MSQDPTRAEYIEALRQFADWLTDNPQAPVPYLKSIGVPLNKNAHVEEAAAALGVEPIYDREGNASFSIQFGPLTYYPYGYVDFAEHVAKHEESRARTWAKEKGMAIRPADSDGGGSDGE